VVRDGNVVTGGGVTASIDLGLYMVEWLVNTDTALQVQQKLEYPYYQAGKFGDIYRG
jgi:cyclohexyl-isocyanide hydratase